MIYFDSAATTLQKPPAVARAVARAIETHASVGRGGHPAAERAAQTVFACRREAAALFGAAPEQVVFTMNATHGLNLAIKTLVKPGGRAVVSGFEHNAVMRPLHALGAELTVVGTALFRPDRLLEELAQALAHRPDAVICTHVSNVFGYILPIAEIAALCRMHAVPLIVDASQSAGTLPISLEQTGAAFLAMPGHKGLYGPQGTGLLLCARPADPLLEGGTGSNSELPQMPDFLPDRLEAGTHNVCGIAGLLEGLRFVRRTTPECIFRREQTLTRLLQRQTAGISGLHGYFGAPQSGVVSFRTDETDCEEAARRLSAAGIAVRAGLHCAPRAHQSAGTLERGTLRVSFSAFSTPAEVYRFAAACNRLFSKK